MVDSNIKRITILRSQLPPIDGSTYSYNVRYRIVSNDKNRYSSWSNVYNIPAIETDAEFFSPGNEIDNHYIKQNLTNPSGGTTKSVTFNWSVDDNKQYKYGGYDIYIKRCSTSSCTEEYQYVKTTSEPVFIFMQTGSETHVQILVQVPTYPKEIIASAKLFESGIVNI